MADTLSLREVTDRLVVEPLLGDNINEVAKDAQQIAKREDRTVIVIFTGLFRTVALIVYGDSKVDDIVADFNAQQAIPVPRG